MTSFLATSVRPRKRCHYVLADKGYDRQVLRHSCDRYSVQPVIPLRKMHRKSRPGLPRLFDSPQHKKRNVSERLFSWLKEKRRICTRYDNLASSFIAMVTLAGIERCLRADVKTTPDTVGRHSRNWPFLYFKKAQRFRPPGLAEGMTHTLQQIRRYGPASVKTVDAIFMRPASESID